MRIMLYVGRADRCVSIYNGKFRASPGCNEASSSTGSVNGGHDYHKQGARDSRDSQDAGGTDVYTCRIIKTLNIEFIVFLIASINR